MSSLSAPSPRLVGLVFGALLVPQFVALGAPSVALPTAGRALGVPFGTMSWVLVAWALMSASPGWLASRWGVRRVLVGNVVLTAVGSALAALAPSLAVLIVGRLIGSFGAGGSIIASYACVAEERLGEEGRARTLGIMAAFAGTASGCGTLLGGGADRVGRLAMGDRRAGCELARSPAGSPARPFLRQRRGAYRPSRRRAVSVLVYRGSSIGPAAVGSLSLAISLPVALAIVAAVPVGGVAVSLVLRPGEPGKSDRGREGVERRED